MLARLLDSFTGSAAFISRIFGRVFSTARRCVGQEAHATAGLEASATYLQTSSVAHTVGDAMA